jgi:hypothetical protein
MKKVIYLLAILTIAFAGCKKNRAFKKEDGKTAEEVQQVQAHADAAINDATNAASQVVKLSGQRIGNSAEVAALNQLTFPCGATIDTLNANEGFVVINYDDVTACNNRRRGGSVKLQILNYSSGIRWKDAGAVLQITFTNYKVTRVSDGKSIKLNGVANVTNVSGGNVFRMAAPTGSWLAVNYTSVVHTVEASSLNVTFDESQTAVWNINRKFTYTCPVQFNASFSNTPVFECKGEGTGSNNGISNLENWGTTRNGNAFTNQVVTPVVWNTSCGAHAPLAGKLNLKVQEQQFDLVVTLGVNAQGNPVSVGLNQCPYGLKVEWTYGNSTGSRIYGYP